MRQAHTAARRRLSVADLLGIRIFDIEASSLCTHDCLFCSRRLLPESGCMKPDTFRAFLDRADLGATDDLTFAGLGEPLTNPRLPEFAALAKSRYPRVHTRVITNGSLLEEDVVRRLTDAGLDVLDVSFNGTDEETYERLTGGGSFQRTLQRVERAVDHIERSGSATRLVVNHIVTTENADEEEAVQSFWRKRGVALFRPQRMHNRAGEVAVHGMTPADRPGLNGSYCEVFELMTFVSWKGDVFPCSHDAARLHRIGNVIEDDLDTIAAAKSRLIEERGWPAMCAACAEPLRSGLRSAIARGFVHEVSDSVRSLCRRVGGCVAERVRKLAASGTRLSREGGAL